MEMPCCGSNASANCVPPPPSSPFPSASTVTGAHGTAKAKKGDRLGSMGQKAQGLRPTSAFFDVASNRY